MSLLLIHGFAVQLHTWFRTKKNTFADFNVFGDEITSGKVKLFWWSPPYSIGFLQTLLPQSYFKLYWDDRARASSSEVLEKLHKEILAGQPSTIVCHSMGCFLLLNYVKRFGSPPSVKKVIFIQADCDMKDLLSSGILETPIQLVNVFRTIDLNLWASSLLHRCVRLGIMRIKFPRTVNHYLPSYKNINLHTAALSDERLKRLLA